MEVELNAEREKLLADKMLVESELKTVNKDLTTQLTTAKSQVDNYKKCISNVFFWLVELLHNIDKLLIIISLNICTID